MTDSRDDPARKDRLIQTRVPRKLESTLKREARRRGVTVSQLIRNVLSSTFDLVEDVVSDVDQIVNDSVALAQQVSRGARRLAENTRGDAAVDRLARVEAWNRVVVNREVTCGRCEAEIEKGGEAYAGFGEQPGPIQAWLCNRCIEAI
jgi:hypothetical protein